MDFFAPPTGAGGVALVFCHWPFRGLFKSDIVALRMFQFLCFALRS